MTKLTTVFSSIALFVLTVGPSIAEIQEPVDIPEPSAFSLLALGIIGTLIATRMKNKK